jgi:hypothetical protein
LTNLEHVETANLLHPHEQTKAVLVGLSERWGWDELARASERLEVAEWTLMDVLNWEPAAELRWTIGRKVGRDGVRTVKLFDEHRYLKDDYLCTCFACHPDDERRHIPSGPLFDEAEPDFYPAFTLDAFFPVCP